MLLPGGLAQAAGKGGRVGVDGLHILQGQLQGQSGRDIRQGRQRVLPDKGRQQLHRADSAGTLLGEQQSGGGAIRLHMQAAVKQLEVPGSREQNSTLVRRFAEGEAPGGLVGIDAPGRCPEAGIERRQVENPALSSPCCSSR